MNATTATLNPARLARWERLEDALRAAGIPADMSVHAGPNGTLVRIVLAAKTGTVELRDHYGRGDRWEGFVVWAENRDGITVQEWPAGRRMDAVHNASSALVLLGGQK